MNSIIETLNQSGGQFLQFAWPMLWQSSLLIGFVLALDFLLARKIRASVRYALWLAVLVKLLLPPTLALPTGAAWWLFHAPPVAKAPVIKSYTVTYDTTPLADYVPPTVALPPPAPPQLNGAGWALLATGVISAGLLLWLAMRWWQVARMVRGAMASEGLVDLMAEVQRQAGLRSRLRLKLIEGRMSPAVCGLFRPVILLPRTLAEQLSPAQLRAVLLHEAFHLRRKDVWVNCAQALLQIVYWWHPLLWIANARIRRVREEAVDDAVMLALRDEADSYAPTLLEVAKLAFRRPLMSLGLVGIMESRSALRQRIERLVGFRAPRKAGLTLASLCGICVFSAVALPMGEAPAPVEKPAAADTIKAESQPERALTFKLNHPEGEDVLKGQLLAAGVKIPPTIIHDFNNGRFFARGTTEQLVLIQQTVLKLNGYSPQEAAAATNIPDYAIKIPVDEPATAQFYSRTFGVSKDAVYANLIKQTGTQSNAPDSVAVSAAFRKLFTEMELNLESPSGKSIFYSEKFGKLFAKTTASDLDVIELAVGALIQPSAQNASGYSPPVDDTNIVGITGVSANSNILAAATNKLVYTGLGRQGITNKLDRIRLDNFSADNLPLSEVLRMLAKQSKLRDPNHEGINFLINPSSDKSAGLPTVAPSEFGVLGIDPATGLPVAPTSADNSVSMDVGSFTVKIPNLTDVRLADVLDAIVVVCDHPIKYSIQDFAVVFSAKGPEMPQLFSRVFKVDALVFASTLRDISGLHTNSVSAMAQSFFSTLGVNWESPAGKSVFYNNKRGTLFVKATESDLDTIERALSAVEQVAPQIHIKAWFLEVPNGTLSGLSKMVVIHNQPAQSNQLASITGILTGANFKTVWQNLENRPGVEILAEPEVTTTSGRQTQMRATTKEDIVYGVVVKTGVETGPILDVVPYVLSDGYTINLTLIPSLTEFLGYDTPPTNAVGPVNNAGVHLPVILPRFSVRQVVTTVNLWDGQTVVLGGLPVKKIVGGKNGMTKSPASDRELLVFVTATIVDPAGNRVHSDGDLPFAQMSVPPQPQKTVSGYFDDMNPNEQRSGRTQ